MTILHPISSVPKGLPLALEDVTCAFGSVVALDHITCQIPAGTIWGLVGPNGAGKSTLLRGLVGLITPTAGSIHVGEWHAFHQSLMVRQHCSALLTPPGLYDFLSAQEHLELVGRIWHMSRRDMASRIQHALEPWGLWPRRFERVAHWSEGMRQQLALAKALFYPTPLLLLDEPTTHLDPEARHQAYNILLNHWNIYHPTILVTSHDLPLIEEFCQIVGILNQGKLLAVAAPDTLRDAGYKQAVTIRASHWTATIQEHLIATHPAAQIVQDQDSVHITIPHRDAVEDLLQLILHDGGRIVEVNTVPSLDETVRHILEGVTD